MKTCARLSPNFGERRNGLEPELVVIHYTAMDSEEPALERLTDPACQVSCHYLIGDEGRVFRLVEEKMRAWHAGRGSWGGRGDVNSRSIGIEIANSGRAPFANCQMIALETLLAEILSRWSIPAKGVIGHSDLALGRKADPGPRFDWRRLSLSGLSVWPKPSSRSSASERDFVESAMRFGYERPANGGDFEFSGLLNAFRLRFRPWARGPLDEVDAGAMRDLAARWPYTAE